MTDYDAAEVAQQTAGLAATEARRAASPHGDGTQLAHARRYIGYLLTGEVWNKAARFGAAVVLARALTPSQFGIFNVGISIGVFAVALTSLGLPELGSRDVAVDRSRAGWIAGRVVTVRTGAVLGVIAVALVVTELAAAGDTGFVLAAGAMALAMAASADWLARGLERMRGVGTATAAGGTVALVGAIVVALGPSSAAAALLAFALGEVVAGALCWRTAGRVSRPRPGIEGLGGLLRRAWPLALSTLVVYIFYANLDTVLLAATRSASEAGLYSAAYRVFQALNMIAVFAAFSIMPMLARSLVEGRPEALSASLRTTLTDLMLLSVLWLGVAEAAGAWFLGAVFGPDFEEMGPTLVVLFIGLGWFSVGYPAGYSTISADRNRRFLAGAAVAGVVNVALNVVLTPAFGAIGAGIATTAALVPAAVVWIAGAELLDRAMMRVLAILVLFSAGGVVALVVSQAAVAIGVVTAASALALAAYRFVRRRRGAHR